MKNKKCLISRIFCLSVIVFAALFFLQIKDVICYANEVHNKQTESLVRDANRLWCNEHGVYEDECFICHPELTSNNSEAPSVVLYCEEHRVPEQECGICRPELATSLAPGTGLKVRLESTESAVKAGVVTVFPDEDKHHSVI